VVLKINATPGAAVVIVAWGAGLYLGYRVGRKFGRHLAAFMDRLTRGGV